ncbi:MAG: putative lipopolysaccharide heptosyltransferase III [Deltaproteobacteria bacterium]|nr:putative lipopolysaccharide heptosyltransferase III [Deltaproteobacteria bacterium]
MMITTPAISALKAAYPEARITMVVNTGTEAMVAGNPDIEEVIPLSRGGEEDGRSGFERNLNLIRRLRSKHFDLSIDFTIGDRGAFLSFLAGAPQRIGFGPKKSKQWWWSLAYTRTVPQPKPNRHIVDSHLDAVRLLGISPGRPRLKFSWEPPDEDPVKDRLREQGYDKREPYLVVHPTSRWMFKTWRLEGYARVIEAVQGELGRPVVVTGGPGKNEMEAVQAILSGCRIRPLDLSGRLNLKQLGALIAGASAFFGVDSAPMHIAAAVGTPVVALFGPSGELMWGPWGRGHRVLKKNWPCRPCGQDGCEGSKISRCLEAIATEDVLAALSGVLAGERAGRSETA